MISIKIDNIVGKRLVVTFITYFFKEYLIDKPLYDLISILKHCKLEDNLVEFFTPGKRSAEAFFEHFTKADMGALVEYNDKKIFEVKVKEMKTTLKTQILEEVRIKTVKQRVKDAKFLEIEVVRIMWDVLMDVIQCSGKNQQQNAILALCQAKLLPEIVRSLYDQDVLAEDTILHWFCKGNNPKGRYVIMFYAKNWLLFKKNICSDLYSNKDFGFR
uniref:5MP1/2-like HEAT domain-containing protein n=1 Tax=Lactuca sativa TaxID=4236 RepID=A0A9R1WDU7_LACSA|nr:hypothetical protein LSAT_V11C200067330 [Lactuca sativa]